MYHLKNITRTIYLMLGFLLVYSSCDKGISGDTLDNTAPETYTVVDTIIRAGEDRLNSQVHVRWWGDDPDGFITDYEFYFDTTAAGLTPWENAVTTSQRDSIFVLSTPPGTDTLDFRFIVRAVDNLGLVDPTPAELSFPIKNSPPSIEFIDGPNNPVCVFPVVKFFWSAEDPDGFENISHFEIVWNDTTLSPIEIPVTASAITLESEDPTDSDAAYRVYLNNSINAESYTISNVLLEDTNRLYIRAIDKSASASDYESSYAVYIKKPESDILLVNGYGNAGSTETAFYEGLMNELGLTDYSVSNLFSTDSEGNALELAPDNLTQARTFNLFKTILWYGNNASASLSLAQRSTSDFFNDGGKLLMSIYVSSSFDEQSSFLEFTPIGQLVEPADTTLLLTDTSTVVALDIDWPVLESTAFVGVVRPFQMVPGASAIYEANIIARDEATNTFSEWEGVPTVIAKKTDALGETNFILSTLELHKLNGAMNMEEFMNKALIEEFGL